MGDLSAVRIQYQQYKLLEKGWCGDEDDPCPAPAPESLALGEAFLAHIESVSNFRTPVAFLDHEGIPGLVWPSDDHYLYLSVAFYPDGDIVYYSWKKADASQESGLFKIENTTELEKLVELIRKVSAS
jgi:hypothetical protein